MFFFVCIDKSQRSIKNDQEQTKSMASMGMLSHRRYEYSYCSKEMVAQDPTSYHQLSLPITDSYLRKGKFGA
jgi:hypothetical protein